MDSGGQQPDAGAPMTSSPDAGVLEHDGGPAIDPDGGLLLSNCDPENGAACDDGNPCNGTEVCDERLKVCISGSPIICADQDQCNGIETCNPETGLCKPHAVTCPDINPCDGITNAMQPQGYVICQTLFIVTTEPM